MISVYRLYLGRAWTEWGRTDSLLRLFDAVPQFLHSMISCPESVAAVSADHAEATTIRYAAIKIAMTHAHVAVICGDAHASTPWTAQELLAAATGFRWRIPVLLILPPGCEIADPRLVRGADRTVAWNGVEIARAIQELAEAAAVARRNDVRHMAPEGMATVATDADFAAGSRARRLPAAEIAAAYDRLRTTADLSSERPVQPLRSTD